MCHWGFRAHLPTVVFTVCWHWSCSPTTAASASQPANSRRRLALYTTTKISQSNPSLFGGAQLFVSNSIIVYTTQLVTSTSTTTYRVLCWIFIQSRALFSISKLCLQAVLNAQYFRTIWQHVNIHKRARLNIHVCADDDWPSSSLVVTLFLLKGIL